MGMTWHIPKTNEVAMTAAGIFDNEASSVDLKVYDDLRAMGWSRGKPGTLLSCFLIFSHPLVRRARLPS